MKTKLNYVFSKKSDGNMSYLWGDHNKVLANRTRFFQSHNLNPNNAVMMSVVHGDNIIKVSRSDLKKGIYDQESAIKTDAMITDQSGIVLSLLTADCLPIIFYDLTKNVLSLAHLGWQGTDLKLSQRVIRIMIADYNCQPKNIKVIIGPGIHKASYIFDRPIKQESYPEWQPFLNPLDDKRIGVDIVNYNYFQITSLGVKNIDISPEDTAKSDQYFSHYRAQKNGEPEGRFLTLATLK